ncbi:hypothetical protein [Flavobacterium pallidum]|uniref:Uncharacterized protein n=1 Tax=Flavobacterium pallidum TaxID=2172098 RepID=A0A2S1SDS8_9FLAO|nr:hypothetical protein [Flavobacterium pallidum]AWI24524.1 hypothetical protein HYN49_00685 [Flavobacterium pallidum]
MKKPLYLILFFVSFLASAQKSINDFQNAIVPVKFDWMSKENQYRVSTIAKMKLNEIGFKTFYDNEILPETAASNRCDNLFIDIDRDNSMFATKLIVIFKDCQNVVVFKSTQGVSKKKDFNEAYADALTHAFESVSAINYKYSGQQSPIAAKTPVSSEIRQKGNIVRESVAPEAKPTMMSSASKLSVEITANGYLVIEESTSTVKFKLSKTTNPEVFIATSQGRQGVLLKKGNAWFFEYYQNDRLISEQTDLKF